MKHPISGVDTCKMWAANYKSWTHPYENMLHHTAAQEENLVNGENAQTNIRIAKLTKDDNKSLIAVSVLAMLFLQGTFVTVRETRGPLVEPC